MNMIKANLFRPLRTDKMISDKIRPSEIGVDDN